MTQKEQEIASAQPADLDSLPRLKGFRLRGLEMTRLETFIDAAFAFAVTMLVISNGQVPDDIPALLAAFKNVPAFVASIAVLSIFWRGHWLWSRRFGLEDGVSILISWAMLVTILIYVYPLKLLFGAMFYFLTNHAVGQVVTARTDGQVRALFAIYALGFAAIALEILFLNLRAWRLRGQILEEMKKPADALAAFTKAFALDRTNEEVQLTLRGLTTVAAARPLLG